MNPYRGKLIVIEGIDGSGKTIETELLLEWLRLLKYKVATCDFPRYGGPPQGNQATYYVRKYLQRKDFGFNYGFGRATKLNPRAVSLMYALDRFDAAFCQEQRPNLWDLIEDGYIVVSNRYTQSNIGHQARKIDDPQERKEFINWLLDFEYNVLGIPRPNMVIFLNLNPNIAFELKAKQRKAEGKSTDAHEVDFLSLKQAHAAYCEAAEMFPDEWKKVRVDEWNGQGEPSLANLRPVKDIQTEIRSHVEVLLNS